MSLDQVMHAFDRDVTAPVLAAAAEPVSEQERLEAMLLEGLRDGAWLDEQKFAPINYAVPGLIPEGFGMLVGAPKAGKSWLMLSILLAVASPNGRALGVIPVGSGRRVFYLALEDGDRRMQDRCRALLSERAAIPPLFHYQTRIKPNTVVATIEAFLSRYPDTALVVIDTLGKVMPPAMNGESAYQRDYRVGGGLKRIADDHPGLALLVLHHDRKAGGDDFVDSVSGTNGLAGAADTIIVLDRKRQSPEGLLMVTGRDVEEAEYALLMNETVWTLEGSDLRSAAARAELRRETGEVSNRSGEILAVVRKHPEGVGAAAVATILSIDRAQADVYLGRLAKSGRVVRASRGLFAPPS